MPRREKAASWTDCGDKAPAQGPSRGEQVDYGIPDEVAQLRLLLVDPKARGIGIGKRLVDEVVRFARSAGYRRITLWTNDVLVSARRIYEACGFRLEAEDRHHSFGHDLVGQNWVLELV